MECQRATDVRDYQAMARLCESASNAYANCVDKDSSNYDTEMIKLASLATKAGLGYKFLDTGGAKARENFRLARSIAQAALLRGVVSGKTKALAEIELILANSYFAQTGGE